MNLMHLKYAVEIAKTGSLNKAAENLYVGQPNLSRAIKELESSLGITIFERSAKGMVLTPDGKTFLGYASKVLSQVEEIESIYKQSAALKQRFSISVPRASYISDAFVRFSKTLDPALPLGLVYKETNALTAVQDILDADYKLGIIRYAKSYDRYFKEMLDQKGLLYELIVEFNYVLIMSRKHPLAENESISCSDLNSYTEIAHADPFVPSLPISVVRKSELPDDTQKHIFVYERCSQFELLCENTDTFMWASPIPQKTLDRYDLVQKSCSDNNRAYKDVLIYKKDYALSELDKSFITELCRTKREIIE